MEFGDGMSAFTDRARQWIGENVVVDFRSPMLAIGRLERADDDLIEMRDADLHDLRDTDTTRELYVVKAARYGVQTNRAVLLVRIDDVLAVARLDDVVKG
jgi:hypothetical protein